MKSFLPVTELIPVTRKTLRRRRLEAVAGFERELVPAVAAFEAKHSLRYWELWQELRSDPASQRLRYFALTLRELSEEVWPMAEPVASRITVRELLRMIAGDFERLVANHRFDQETTAIESVINDRELLQSNAEAALGEVKLAFENFTYEDSECERLFEQAELALDSLVTVLRQMDVEHLALEFHFRKMLSFTPVVIDEVFMNNMLEVYRTLFALRDEYFVAPRPGLLSEYLATAEAVSNSRALRRLVRATRRVAGKRIAPVEPRAIHDELEEVTLELEVLSMLEQVGR